MPAPAFSHWVLCWIRIRVALHPGRPPLTLMKKQPLPVRKTMCATCPFREESAYKYLQETLIASALTQSSRICHSTGSNNAINKRTGLPPHLCRGSRDLQLQALAAIGFLESPTDEAWNEKCLEMGMEPRIIQDPVKK